MTLYAGIRSGIRSGLRAGLNPGAVVVASVTPTVLTSGTNAAVGGLTCATASITPVADQVIYAAILAGTANPDTTPTCSGNGLTWVQIATALLGTGRRHTVFRAQGASPTAGAVTFTFGNSIQTGDFGIVQCSGADTSGTNGSGATAQVVTLASGGPLTTRTSTLVSPAATSVHLCFIAHRLQAASITPTGTFVELYEGAVAGPAPGSQALHWALGQASCSPTFASEFTTLTSIEVKAA